MDYSSSIQNAKRILEKTRCSFTPPEDLNVWEWADKYRILSADNALPGQWKSFKFQKKPMEALTKPGCHAVTLMFSSQNGKSDIALNFIGREIHLNPRNINLMQPGENDLKKFRDTKLMGLINSVPELRALVANKRSMDGTYNSRVISFAGGFLFMSIAGSTSSQKSSSSGVMVNDEIDEYEKTTQGSAEDTIEARATTFVDEIVLNISTPTTEDESSINEKFIEGDNNYYWIPCPRCKKLQKLDFFAQVFWEKVNDKPDYSTARYECAFCKGDISDKQKDEAVEADAACWIPEDAYNGHHSFQLSALYSPFVTWEKSVRRYYTALKNGSVASFIQTFLGIPTKSSVAKMDYHRLYERREKYPDEQIPEGGVFLTAAADIQLDRSEIEVKAWGRNGESWSVCHRVYEGDTGDKESMPYVGLTAVLLTKWMNPYGVELGVEMFCVDSNYHTSTVKAWAEKHRFDGRVRLILGRAKGDSIMNKPRASDIDASGRKTRKGPMVWIVNSDKGKREIYRRLSLNINDDGSYPFGYMHYPEYGIGFFRQLVAEALRQVKNKRGYIVEAWVKMYARNEGLDLAVYNLACFESIWGHKLTDSGWRRLEKKAGIVKKEQKNADNTGENSKEELKKHVNIDRPHSAGRMCRKVHKSSLL